jgi:hypothetical protein
VVNNQTSQLISIIVWITGEGKYTFLFLFLFLF